VFHGKMKVTSNTLLGHPYSVVDNLIQRLHMQVQVLMLACIFLTYSLPVLVGVAELALQPLFSIVLSLFCIFFKCNLLWILY
jgi:hypothetical protein